MRYLCSFLILLCLNSCRKEKEAVPPVIVIESPGQGSSYNAGEIIRVKGTVDSQTELQSLTIRLVNIDIVSVATAGNPPFTGNSVAFNAVIEIPLTLQSGKYYIEVAAANSENDSKKFQDVIISSAQTVRTDYVVVTDQALGTSLFKGDSIPASYNLVQNFIGKYSSSSTESGNDILGLTFTDHDFVAFSLKNNTVAWELPGFNSSEPTYSNVNHYNQKLYISHFQDGVVKAYDVNGIPGFNSLSPASFKPVKTFVWNSYLITENSSSVGSQSNRLTVNYLATGSPKQEALVDFSIVDVAEKNTDELLVLGNKDGRAQLRLYSLANNTLSSVVSLPAEKLVDVVKISEDDLLISTKSQIFTYRISTNSLVPYLGLPHSVLDYNPESEELFVGSGKTLTIYQSGQLKQTVLFSDTIRAIHHSSSIF